MLLTHLLTDNLKARDASASKNNTLTIKIHMKPSTLSGFNSHPGFSFQLKSSLHSWKSILFGTLNVCYRSRSTIHVWLKADCVKGLVEGSFEDKEEGLGGRWLGRHKVWAGKPRLGLGPDNTLDSCTAGKYQVYNLTADHKRVN